MNKKNIILSLLIISATIAHASDHKKPAKSNAWKTLSNKRNITTVQAIKSWEPSILEQSQAVESKTAAAPTAKKLTQRKNGLEKAKATLIEKSKKHTEYINILEQLATHVTTAMKDLPNPSSSITTASAAAMSDVHIVSPLTEPGAAELIKQEAKKETKKHAYLHTCTKQERIKRLATLAAARATMSMTEHDYLALRKKQLAAQIRLADSKLRAAHEQGNRVHEKLTATKKQLQELEQAKLAAQQKPAAASPAAPSTPSLQEPTPAATPVAAAQSSSWFSWLW